MKFLKFKWGNPDTELTLVELLQPEQPPPACKARPHWGNYFHFYCGNRERKKKKRFWLADVTRELCRSVLLKPHVSVSLVYMLMVVVDSKLYLRICSSNWTVLCVSFSRGTVKRRPAHSCQEKESTYKSALKKECYTVHEFRRNRSSTWTTRLQAFLMYSLPPADGFCDFLRGFGG